MASLIACPTLVVSDPQRANARIVLMCGDPEPKTVATRRLPPNTPVVVQGVFATQQAYLYRCHCGNRRTCRGSRARVSGRVPGAWADMVRDWIENKTGGDIQRAEREVYAELLETMRRSPGHRSG